jgi:hypothetical protein
MHRTTLRALSNLHAYRPAYADAPNAGGHCPQLNTGDLGIRKKPNPYPDAVNKNHPVSQQQKLKN